MNFLNAPVSLRGCPDYEKEHIDAALDHLLADLGGLSAYINPGETVLLKVNLLLAKGPEVCATTHPALVRSLAERLVSLGAKVFIGDSPGGPFNAPALRLVYGATGMIDAAKQSGAELSYDTAQTDVSLPAGHILKKLTLTRMSQSADKVISVCKLKTHSMMTYTGAVKNMFGTVPGTVKAEYHVRMPQMEDFAEAMLDICEATRPVLSFMDAVIGMEGNGPSGGENRPIGCLLASASPYALDAAAASLIGLSSGDVPTLSAAERRGLSSGTPEIIGESPDTYRVSDFRLPDHVHRNLSSGGFIPPFLMKWLRPKVTFQKDRCVGCGICERNCPAKAIRLKDRLPEVSHASCIRCYCCQELCPQKAVRICENALMRLANKI